VWYVILVLNVCLVHRIESFCFTIQVVPFLNINGEQIWTHLEYGYSCVESHQQNLGMWSVTLVVFVDGR
jgi:hypothetical protein